MAPPFKSLVWQFFEKSADNKHAKCCLCNQELKYFTSTSNLRHHLQRKHTVRYNEAQSQQSEQPHQPTVYIYAPKSGNLYDDSSKQGTASTTNMQEEESHLDEAELATEIILMNMESSSADVQSVEVISTDKNVENSEIDQNKTTRQQNPVIHKVTREMDSALSKNMGLKDKLLREEHELNMKHRKEEHVWKKQKYDLEMEDQKLKVKIHLEQLRLLKALNQKIARDELLKFALNDINV